ncbi:MAG: 5-oxoprolinase subunit PxpB [Gordonibacter sp.]|nr:5-oxoprolinase subunit PxpB [Gordonibacter sp.]
MAGFTITIAGDSALNLEFANTISAETSAKIRMAAENLTADPIKGITELVPTFCSLMVYYNPLIITFDELSTRLRGKLRDVGEVDLSVRKIVQIPVCYGGDFGPDLESVAKHANLSPHEVIKMHTAHDYLIDMLGFLPGFAYLGGLDPRLHTPRLATPRTLIEPGSVGIGGAQTGIYPLASPGGWQIIGRTPLRPYDPDRTKPILYAAGEYLRFIPIAPDEYAAIETQLAANTYEYRIFVEGE